MYRQRSQAAKSNTPPRIRSEGIKESGFLEREVVDSAIEKAKGRWHTAIAMHLAPSPSK